MKGCGQCDNCLRKKNVILTTEEFSKISDRIYHYLPEEGTEIKQLLHNLAGIKKDNVWKVLDYLQAEKKLKVDNKGVIKRN